MDANASTLQGVEMASNALDASVIEYLRSVQDRGGTIAFDKIATNLVIDVCVVLAQKLGPERLFELFDNIEALVNPSRLPHLIGK